MRGQNLKTTVLVVLWSAIFTVAMLVTFFPVGVLAGLGLWAILRARLSLTRASAIPFALSFLVGQFPSYFTYAFAYINGFGGVEGPPEWFIAVTLASGGLLAGLCQFLGLPKSWRNFGIWIPASSLAWGVTALGDLPIRGIVVFSALCSGLVTGLAMLALSPRPSSDFTERSEIEGLATARARTTRKKGAKTSAKTAGTVRATTGRR